MNQSDVAFLNEIGQFEAVAAVFVGDLHDKPQVGNDEFFRRFHIVVFLQAHGQLELFLGG